MNKIEELNVDMALAILTRAYSIKAHCDPLGAEDTPYIDIYEAIKYLQLALPGESE